MAETRRCSNCGHEIPANAPQGLCPACLLGGAIASQEEGQSAKSGKETTADADGGQARTAADTVAQTDRTAGSVRAKRTGQSRDPARTANFVPGGDGSVDPGTRIRYFGDYEILGELGDGAMGFVYKARQISLNRLVALKMIRAGAFASVEELRRFQNEAEAVAGLDHPHIVPIHEVGEHDGRRYFSMKLIGGPCLSRTLASYSADPKSAARLMVTVSGAVHHAHQRGILHRDLKPSNILLDEQGQPHVSDFGLAKRVAGGAGLTMSGSVLGTPAYMAPEQSAGNKRLVTTLSDVYGLGAVLYALLTGKAPFDGDSVLETLDRVRQQPPIPPSRINPKVPRDLEIMCLKCLEKDPRRRYTSAQVLAEELNRFLSGEPIVARPVGLAERAMKWIWRRPVIASLAATTALAILVGVVGISWQWRRAEANFIEEESQRKIAETNYEEAETQRKIAEANYGEAETQRKIAEAKTVEARARAEDLERQGYISLVALSLRENQADNITLAEQSLDRCPTHLRGWEWRYCNWMNHRELRTIRCETGTTSIYRAALSPDGVHIACIGGNSVWVCDLGGTEICVMKGHDDNVMCVAWSPDGKTIATGGKDHLIRIWDSKTGAEQGVLRGHNIFVLSVRFSLDGSRLAAAAGAHVGIPNRHAEVKLWDVAARREIRSFEGISGASANAVALSTDGKLLAAVEQNSAAHVWEVDTGKMLKNFRRGHTQPVFGVAFSPDGRHWRLPAKMGLWFSGMSPVVP